MSTMIGVDMSKGKKLYNRNIKPIGYVEKPEINVFNGFTSYVGILSWFIQNKITKLEVNPDITIVEVRGDTIVVPPHLESLCSGMLEEIKRHEMEITYE